VACGPAQQDPRRLTVAAAASLREVLESTKPSFVAEHPGAEVTFSFGASSRLARQIEAGAAFDVFLSADAESVDRAGGRVVAVSRAPFLGNRLVMVARPGLAQAPAAPAELVGTTLRIALAGPAVPAGRYARELLAGLGLLASVEPRVANATDARATLALVESGAADVAFVYLTDARDSRAVLLWTAPAGHGPAIAYVAAALTATGATATAPLAGQYLLWLRGPRFLAEARRLGFLPP
jgi:molybdate transport system substrate-binding protein